MDAEAQFQANCAVMATRPNMGGMADELRKYPLCNIQLVPTPSGALYGNAWDIVTQQWVPLCDPRDPMGQAEHDVEALYTRDVKVFTLLGMGLGYFATAFARRLEPHQRLVVWDADATLFKAMCYSVDISPLFGDKRTDVFIGDQIVGQIEPWWLRLEAAEKLHIAPPLRAGYTNICQKVLYDAMFEKTVEMMRFHAVGLSTWRMFGGHIGDNDLRNIPEYFSTPGMEHLQGIWSGLPAVCLAAGPSLQKNLRYLLPAAVRNKIALLSVGTVYALLRGLGLDPDLVTTIDFQRLNWTDQFQYVPLDPDCPLLYLHSTYPQTPRRWPGPRFVAENASDTVTWLRRYGEGKKSAATVQTVAHLNIFAALEMGANPIILLGQDLSMPVDSHHAAGARAQDGAPNEAGPDAFILGKDFRGNPVHTRHSFLSMKTVFDRIILENPGTTFINASEAGLPLQGAHNLSLRETLDLIIRDDKGQDSRTLRPLMKSIAQKYVPQVKDTFTQDWAQLCQWTDELGDMARTMLRDVRETEYGHILVWEFCAKPDRLAAVAASDIMSVEDAAMDLRFERLKALIQSEAHIHTRQAAFALFAIRRFDFLELMATIPPSQAVIDTPMKQCEYNAGRLVRVAQIILEELPAIQRVLREVTRRMQRTPGRWEARQQYAGLLESVRCVTKQAEVLGHYYYHTQQYDAALAIFEHGETHCEKLARIRRHLDAYRASIREVLGAYFPQGTSEESTATAVPDDTGMIAPSLPVVPVVAVEPCLDVLSAPGSRGVMASAGMVPEMHLSSALDLWDGCHLAEMPEETGAAVA